MAVSMMAKVGELEIERVRLNKMHAKVRLKAEVLPEVLVKIVRPFRRRVLVENAVKECGLSIRPVCGVFAISGSGYRYEVKYRAESGVIADWLLRLTEDHRTWDFGLFFQYLQRQWMRLKPQARVLDISGVGVEPAHQAVQAMEAGQVGTADGARTCR